MPPSVLALPAKTSGIRVFRGYKLPDLPKEEFFRELGQTFMPGTPLMQAPLGLAAYLPAVLDLPDDMEGFPDEVALIVYANRGVYNAFRNGSLSRRMYTASHRAVFDMDRSVGEFVRALPNDPNPVPQPWCLSDEPVDWQDGETRVVFMTPTTQNGHFRAALYEAFKDQGPAAARCGYDQIVCVAASNYAALWLHSSDPPAKPVTVLDLMPTAAEVVRDLVCQRTQVIGDADGGITISGAAAYNWIFSRHMQFFVDTPYPD